MDFFEFPYFQIFELFNSLHSPLILQSLITSILISNYILVVLTSRSVTHPLTAPLLARLTSQFLPY
jgi:hypothetical protein